MVPTVIFAGLACGMLLAVGGMAAWGFYQPAPAFFRPVGTVRWMVGALLLASACSAWVAGYDFYHVLPRLLLAAAAIAPPRAGEHQPHPLRYALSLALSLIPAGVGLYLAISLGANPPAYRVPLSLREIVVAAGSGVGARVLEGVIVSLIAHSMRDDSSGDVLLCGADAVLALLPGVLWFVNLLQYGKVWAGERIEVHLFSAWVIWHAARLTQSYHLWLHRALLASAGLVFVLAGL
ncbi:MAG: hypothetical protein N2508_09160 [Anaerolineae bacterium]|nr:hypothetical protein [Anaerolineae bacterium]